jgi:transcription elongation factor Elf1
MGGRKRRRKVVKRVPKRVPKVFNCPSCDSRSVTVELDDKRGVAFIHCGTCGLQAEIEVPKVFEVVHAFNRFVDLYYEGKIGGLVKH